MRSRPSDNAPVLGGRGIGLASGEVATSSSLAIVAAHLKARDSGRSAGGLVPFARIVYAHHGDGESVIFHTTVTFADEDGATRVTMRAVFPTATVRAEVIERYHADEGAEQNMDRMVEYVRGGLK